MRIRLTISLLCALLALGLVTACGVKGDPTTPGEVPDDTSHSE